MHSMKEHLIISDELSESDNIKKEQDMRYQTVTIRGLLIIAVLSLGALVCLSMAAMDSFSQENGRYKFPAKFSCVGFFSDAVRCL